MNTLLADRSTALDQAQKPGPESAGPDERPYGQMSTPQPSCESCGAMMVGGQEWCLQCGAGAPGSLGERPDWRPLAAIAAATVILLGGAAAAAYAALSQPVHKSPLHVVIASVPPPTATTPTTSAPLPTTPQPSTLTPTPTTPTTPGSTSTLPTISTKPPKIPALSPTPSTSNTGGATNTTTSTTTSTSTSTTPAAATPNPILLDTNAASTYNPYGSPAANFGDPSLAIDSETTTAWTVKVDPSSAPHMAEGLVLDLRTPHHLGSLEVQTPTPGMTVEIYGAVGSAPPATITDQGWTKLNGSHVLKKKTATLKLHTGGAAFRFVVLWLTKAPAGAPHVSVSEVALFPPTG
jgi:hypothetical protein